MNRLLRTTLVMAAAIILSICNSRAQFTGAGLGDFVVSPVQDSVSLVQLQQHLEAVRKTKGRPTIALVLSGGGAKGAAHVGVIKYLEEKNIPIDLIVGTSVGGLIGGFYSLGYDSHYLDSLVRYGIDWNTALTDAVPTEYRSYSDTKYREKFILSIPFFYPKSYYGITETQSPKDSRKHKDLKLGADGRHDNAANDLVYGNLFSTLPSGLVYGQNVSNIINSLTVGYQDSLDFKSLPIPFVCVSTDMVSGKTKVWYDGNISTALRSTMSIPGLFTPVREKGYILVDGGLRDNYPCDIAKAAGADFIIGVDLNSGYKSYVDVNNLSDIIGQGIDMLGRESYEYNSHLADVSIRPDVTGYNMLSFNNAAIDTLVTRGYKAALKHAGSIESLAGLASSGRNLPAGKDAVDIGQNKVLISSVRVEGAPDLQSRYVHKRLKAMSGNLVSRDDIEDVVAAIYGTGAFDYVNFALLGTQEPYELLLKCKRGPVHQLGLGARFDSEEIVSVLVNAGFYVRRLQGLSVDVTARASANPYAEINFGIALPSGMSLNLAAYGRYADRNKFTIGQSDFKIAYWYNRQEAYFSNIHWKQYDVKLGLRNDIWNVTSIMANNYYEGYDVDDFNRNYQAPYLSIRTDTFDDCYFPTKGMTMGVDAAHYCRDIFKGIKGFTAIRFDGRFHTPITRWMSFIPSYNVRLLFGDDIGMGYTNCMGGSIVGRYLDQQIPFIGINNAVTMNKFLSVARADLRFRLSSNNYITAIANVAATVDNFVHLQNLDEFEGFVGYGLEYSYNSILGPFTANIHWSSYTKRVGLYVGFGLNF